jgi:hypothetical protein
MVKTAVRFASLSLVIALALTSGWVRAAEKCTLCHGRKDFTKTEETGRKISLYVDENALKSSIHGARGCTDCHVDVVAIPHKAVKKVNCKRCHYSGNPVGAPQGVLYDQFEQSVHGVEVLKGNAKAPVCQDCHGTHDITPPDSASSSMYKLNRPKTCGRCHVDIYATYKESVHGEALAKGNLDAPDCSSCHGEHNIRPPSDPTSQVSPANVAHTCSNCHGPVGVVAKYGIKTDRTATFEESFHGIARVMKNMTVANCSSCHGFHDVRRPDDPKSSVYPANIVKTCGRPGCHPEATPQFAKGKIHVDPTSKESGILYYITKFFAILTISTLIGLFIFIILDLLRRAKAARAGK